MFDEIEEGKGSKGFGKGKGVAWLCVCVCGFFPPYVFLLLSPPPLNIHTRMPTRFQPLTNSQVHHGNSKTAFIARQAGVMTMAFSPTDASM